MIPLGAEAERAKMPISFLSPTRLNRSSAEVIHDNVERTNRLGIDCSTNPE